MHYSRENSRNFKIKPPGFDSDVIAFYQQVSPRHRLFRQQFQVPDSVHAKANRLRLLNLQT